MGFIIAAAVAAAVIAFCFLCYKKAPPTQAIVVTGFGLSRPKVVCGRGVFVLPIVQRADRLNMRLLKIDVKTPETGVKTKEGVSLWLDSVVTVQVYSENSTVSDEEVRNAGYDDIRKYINSRQQAAISNFLGMDEAHINEKINDVLQGNLREIVSEMTVDQILTNRKQMAVSVVENARPDLAKMGLEVVTFNVQDVKDAVDAMGSSRDNVQDYRAAWLYGILTPDGALRSASDSGSLASEMTRVTLIPLSDYNALTGTELTLSDGEVYVYGHRMTYTAPQFTVGDTTWRVKSLLDRCTVNGASAADVTPSLYVVVPDFESAARLLLDLSANSDLSVQLRWYYQFDSDLPDDAQHSGSASYGTDGVPASLTDALQLALYNVNAETDLTTGWEVESLAANRSDFYGAYGGLFYLGIMLSAVFSLAAVSIIYYKQVCEGYEDQSRFAIMQKVGMTKQDIRRSINSQLLTVFFLPMALSGVHLCFAFPFIHKLLLLFNLSNTSLLIGTTVVCYVAFALLYTLAYKLTSNAYYHIVSGAAERE